VYVKLHDLIPDIPLKEYRPAGLMPLSAWQNFNRRVCWGLRGRARRVWVNSNASNEYPLVIDSEIESWHCQKDAQLLLNASKPGIEILTQFRDLGVEISEHASSGERILSWNHDGLRFVQRVFTGGRYAHSTTAVTRGHGGDSEHVADHIAAVRRNIDNVDEHSQKRCVHVWWRYIYTILFYSLIVVVPAFAAAAIIDISTALLYFPVGIIGLFAYSLWIADRNRKYLNKMWSRLFRTGRL